MADDQKEATARLFQCLTWLGYTEAEIKAAITFFNQHHEWKIHEYAPDFASAMLVRIIERWTWHKYEKN